MPGNAVNAVQACIKDGLDLSRCIPLTFGTHKWQEKVVEWNWTKLEPLGSQAECSMFAEILEVALNFFKREASRSFNGIANLLSDNYSSGDMFCFIFESHSTQTPRLRLTLPHDSTESVMSCSSDNSASLVGWNYIIVHRTIANKLLSQFMAV